MSEELWIRGSSAHLLLECPARWMANVMAMGQAHGLGESPTKSEAAKVGEAVHAALEHWFRQERWDPPDIPILDELLLLSLSNRGITVASTATKIARRSLSLRAAELSTWVRMFPGATPEPEVVVRDPQLRVSGRADLVVWASSGFAVLDVKTGKHNALQVRTQLTVYAKALALIGGPMLGAAVFSPRAGIDNIAFREGDVEDGWLDLKARREQVEAGRIDVSPSPITCKYCPIRASCDEHWDAVSEGTIRDAVRGTLLRKQLAANGQTALVLQTATGIVQVSQISHAAAVVVGEQLAILEIVEQAPGGDLGRRRGSTATRVESLVY